MRILTQPVLGAIDSDAGEEFKGTLACDSPPPRPVTQIDSLELTADGEDRVQRCHRVLEDGPDFGPKQAIERSPPSMQQAPSVECKLTGKPVPTGWKKIQERKCGHGLAAPGLTGDAQGLTGHDVE
jgi:hypothetical protein